MLCPISIVLVLVQLCSSAFYALSYEDKQKRNTAKIQSARRQKMMMASFSFPQLYGCIDYEEKIVPDELKHQGREDEWLWDKIFSRLPSSEVYGGTFIEIGALAGERHANSWYFEKKWDWRGLLIEGHPLNTPHLRSSKMQRSNTVVYTSGICRLDNNNNPGTVEFSSRADAVGISRDNNISNTERHEWQYKMPCIPLQDMLDTTGVLDVDMFSLDVEGAELFILKTIDWHASNIRVLVVEANGFDKEKDKQVRDLMEGLGYINSKDMNLGTMSDYCNATTGCGLINDVFINPRFHERKVSRAKSYGLVRYYDRNTGMRCNSSVEYKKRISKII